MKNKKILIVFAFLFLFVLFISGECSAFSYDYNDTTINVPEIPQEAKDRGFIICGYGDGCDSIENGATFLVYPLEDVRDNCFYYLDNRYNNRNLCYKTTNSDKGKLRVLKINQKKTEWIEETKYLSDSHDMWSNYVFAYPPTYSKYCIYEDSSYSSIFFQGTPLGIVTQKVQALNLEETMGEIVGILPQILVIVVSLVGLRKALKTLSTLLHRA